MVDLGLNPTPLKATIVCISCSGKGKSSLCKHIYRKNMGRESTKFKESNHVDSTVMETLDVDITTHGATIIDSPGFSDTKGPAQSLINLRLTFNDLC